jgi:hypothetical protein
MKLGCLLSRELAKHEYAHGSNAPLSYHSESPMLDALVI